MKEKNNQQNKTNYTVRSSSMEVSKFLDQNEIKTNTDLFPKTCEQKEVGKKDLVNYLVSRNPKSM